MVLGPLLEMGKLASTNAKLRVLNQSFSQKLLEGEVAAGGFHWEVIQKDGIEKAGNRLNGFRPTA